MSTTVSLPAAASNEAALLPDKDHYEVIDGRLVEMKMGNKATWIASELARILGNYVVEHKLGWVFAGEAGYRLDPKRPHNLRRPDVSFVQFGRLPNEEPADAYDQLAPDLAVEVVSPNDTVEELAEKLEEYRAGGVRLIWVVVPATRTVQIHRPSGPILVMKSGEQLSGEEVVPGFTIPIASLFKFSSRS